MYYYVTLWTFEDKILHLDLKESMAALERSTKKTAKKNQRSTREALEKESCGTEGPWITSDRCTLADISCFSWIDGSEWAGVDCKVFQRWASGLKESIRGPQSNVN